MISVIKGGISTVLARFTDFRDANRRIKLRTSSFSIYGMRYEPLTSFPIYAANWKVHKTDRVTDTDFLPIFF